jgi:hypothetical protein
MGNAICERVIGTILNWLIPLPGLHLHEQHGSPLGFGRPARTALGMGSVAGVGSVGGAARPSLSCAY